MTLASWPVENMEQSSMFYTKHKETFNAGLTFFWVPYHVAICQYTTIPSTLKQRNRDIHATFLPLEVHSFHHCYNNHMTHKPQYKQYGMDITAIML